MATEPEFIKLNVSTSFSDLTSQRTFPSNLTLNDLKCRLEIITGAPPATMQLEVFNKDGTESKPIPADCSFPLSVMENGMTLRVHDLSSTSGDFNDTSNVQKFELSDEEYAKRQASLLKFKETHRLGQFNEEQKAKMEEQANALKALEAEKLATMKVGDRCEVNLPNNPSKRGVVAFIGETHFKEGIWIGIKYDLPVGKNNGSVGGRKYFECSPNYGGFVRANSVEVGDFPEEMEDALMDEI